MARAAVVLSLGLLLLSADAAAAAPSTIFGSATPATIDSGDSNSVELGVKFSSEVAGNITGVRFYKATTNTGTHIGSLWSTGGTLLASATFSGESASGWQQVSFSKPVAITANTTYIAAYLAPKGHYSDTSSGFAAAGVSNPPLSALANSVSANGVYTYSTTSVFPSSTYKATNYWVDVNFEPAPATAPGQVTNVSATAGNGSASLTWSAPTSGGAVTTYTITPYVGSEAKTATTITGTPPATSTTISGLTNGTTYTFKVTASNSAGPGPPSEPSNAVTPTAPTAADTIFGSATPATIDSGDTTSVELGVKFSSEVAGTVTGIRFYKATTNTGTHIGSLWSTGGTLLASATFSGESASGWQQVSFSKPVAITANTTYIAAYLAPKGHYSDTSSGFAAAGVSNPPLSALANSVSANGVYTYSTTSVFPSSTYKATNYWVDVNFEPAPATAPGQVTNVSATAGNGSASLTWSAPTSGGAVTTYTITPYVGSEAKTATTITGTPPATSTTISGLTNGTTYTFKVTASNSAGPGPPSEPSNAVTPVGTPFAPTAVTATAGNGNATVSWTAPSNGGSPITKYTITPYVGSEAKTATTIMGAPPGTSTTISGLTNGTTYTFKVTASNSAGPGPPSEPSNAVTPVGTPFAPTAVTATAGNGNATVSWTAPSNGGSPITKYTITPYVGSEAKTATTIMGAPPGTSTTISGLTNGTTYTFKVTASNAVGESPPSSPSNAVTPASTPIAYPDLQVLMPTGDVAIVHKGSTKMLEFTHNTEDAGAGPLEMRPVYNPLSGISQGYQALYTMPSPGVWKFAYTVPIVGPMIWTPPSDYNFPLDKFWLYNVASGGGIGSLAGTSPKDLFCMTSDAYVGGVPNTPSTNGYPNTPECSEPEGRLGLSVGWGDQYDATDGGEGIEISSLPNGTYWLRGEVDPYHYFIESNTSNNITDTKVRIEGETVTVLEQTHPESTPPTVTVTSPAAEATVSGTTSLSATASGPAPISSVQFLLDGEPIGAPVTTPPYTFNWTVGSTPPGKHYLSAQATDANGFIGTASDTPVTVQEGSGGGSGTEPPTVSIINPVAGETVFNTTRVSATVSDAVAIQSVQYYLDGKPLGAPVTAAPYPISWNTSEASNGSHTLTAAATDIQGNIGTSAPVSVTVQNPLEEGPCFVMDATVNVEGHGIVTTPGFTTAEAGEQLFAFVASDGPGGALRQSARVSGAGLTWTLVKRANLQSGDAEIWTATATTSLSNVTVTSTPAAGGYDQSLTAISMQMSQGVGASVAGGAASGAPSVSLKTTEEGSLVYAVGADYDHAIARTLGPNQVMLRQNLDPSAEETFWSQFTGAVTGPAGETVTLNDTTPTGDTWNMAAVEIRGDGPDS